MLRHSFSTSVHQSTHRTNRFAYGRHTATRQASRNWRITAPKQWFHDLGLLGVTRRITRIRSQRSTPASRPRPSTGASARRRHIIPHHFCVNNLARLCGQHRGGVGSAYQEYPAGLPQHRKAQGHLSRPGNPVELRSPRVPIAISIQGGYGRFSPENLHGLNDPAEPPDSTLNALDPFTFSGSRSTAQRSRLRVVGSPRPMTA
jgi:hypothetical protein